MLFDLNCHVKPRPDYTGADPGGGGVPEGHKERKNVARLQAKNPPFRNPVSAPTLLSPFSSEMAAFHPI